MLDTASFSISTTHYERSPVVTFDGRNYLIVWVDNRGGSSDIIYGARVNPSGVVLDTNGIAISPLSTSPSFPKIAFDGRNYLVVWEIPGVAVVGSRVTPDGVVLDPNPIVIGTATYFYWGSSLNISFDGRNYLVVWSGAVNGGSYDIYGARVTPAGVVLDPHGLNICSSPNDQVSPAVGFDGDNYNVVWSDRRNGPSWNLYWAKLDPSGVVIDSFPVVIQAGDQITPTITHGPINQQLVAYSGFTSSINGRPANTMRIWGKLSPWSSGTEEKKEPKNLVGRVSLRVYPNPFSEKTRFNVGFDLGSLNAKTNASLKVYDALGRLVRDFPLVALKPGPLDWDGTDSNGRKLPGGVYFIRLEQGDSRITEKVILLR